MLSSDQLLDTIRIRYFGYKTCIEGVVERRFRTYNTHAYLLRAYHNDRSENRIKKVNLLVSIPQGKRYTDNSKSPKWSTSLEYACAFLKTYHKDKNNNLFKGY